MYIFLVLTCSLLVLTCLLLGDYHMLPEKELHRSLQVSTSTVQTRKLKHDYPPTSNQSEKENQHRSSSIHAPTFWNLR